VLKKQLEENKRKIRDPVFASMVLNTRSSMIFARNPPISDIGQIRDLMALKACVKTGTALRELDLKRKTNELYFRMKGISQYTEKLLADGITDSTWRIATNNKNEPITYDLIRGLMDEDALKAEEDAKEFALELDAYKADRERFNKEMEEYRKAMEEGRDYLPPDVDAEDEYEPAEEDVIPEIPIYMEVQDRDQEPVQEDEEKEELMDPNSDEFWQDEGYYIDDEFHMDSIDFVNGVAHSTLQYYLSGWCSDEVEWFLTEVAA